MHKIHWVGARRASPALWQPIKPDHAIDALVYQLYGLTDAEIKIVEAGQGARHVSPLTKVGAISGQKLALIWKKRGGTEGGDVHEAKPPDMHPNVS